ncbi:hypothetical protein C1H46_033691 [Malus baccata]|uniref:AP2/ERF domain-containing protein n=1 Tax=Malus baccata TaxID=106549 RepID=A0A540L2Q1_MALBA|nr:hypothetical protein C1H46_033691 [Malus baccata]
MTRHHQHGRWQARIGRVAGNKDLYLGTFGTQEEAAEAYDIAAIKFRGANAVTNFDITKYDVEKIMSSNTLLAGEFARRAKVIEPNIAAPAIEYNPPTQNNAEVNQPEINNGNSLDWKMALYQSAAQQQADSCANNLPVNMLPVAYPNQSHGQSSYSSNDLPKSVVMTLRPGSTVKSMDFHPMQQILLLVGTNMGDVMLYELPSHEKDFY